jgi:integrase
MKLDELNKLLFNSKMSREGMERMNRLLLLPGLPEVKNWKNTFCGRFILKYPKYYGIIAKIKNNLGFIPDWKDFTKSNIDNLSSVFSGCAQSSRRTYFAMIKAVLNDARDEFTLPYLGYQDRLSVKNTPSISVYLNLNELSILESYRPENEKEKIILAQFLCGCYTGARHSDVLEMTDENISNGYIYYVSKKTKTATTIEAKPVLHKLLPIAGKKRYSDSSFNDTIRDICRKAGINERVKLFRRGKNETGEKWKFIASHTARRSFATNLAELGVPILQISKRMGHSDIKMTQGYICCGIGKLDKNAIQFFK